LVYKRTSYLPSGYLTYIAMENHHLKKSKPSINGPFSMAMLNNQMVREHPIKTDDLGVWILSEGNGEDTLW
jgi:hypothetical protein